MHCTRRRGFTFVELMITISVLGILALAVMPSFTSDAPLRLIATSNLVTSDLEYAQAATLNDPGDPLILRIDAEGEQYWLALSSDPETPIMRPDVDEPYVVDFGSAGEDILAGVTIAGVGLETEGTLVFDAFGRLTQLGDVAFQLTNESGDLYVLVSASTGSVTISNEAPEVGR
ncbi:MAG: prepilin-type N-terminal cleavage/methylation domain-containing protein [Phycisphaerales bacterium]|nr:prepilin-type N-terminal cleavage/methylation domain-containing protein [Phycisphaerales bacterium]